MATENSIPDDATPQDSFNKPDGDLHTKRYWETRQLKIKVLEHEGKLVPIGELGLGLRVFSERLRKFGEQMARKNSVPGPDIQRGLNAILDDLCSEFEVGQLNG